MLEVRGLTKKHRHRSVVDRVTFTFPRGGVTGYLGPDGSGKSTRVKMLAGLISATSGQTLWEGAPGEPLLDLARRALPARRASSALDPFEALPNQ